MSENEEIILRLKREAWLNEARFMLLFGALLVDDVYSEQDAVDTAAKHHKRLRQKVEEIYKEGA